jgi:YesN/AraC family two-component response regulator
MQAGVDLRELIGNKNNTQTNDENLPSNVRNGSTIGTSDRSTNNASTKSPSSSNERVGQAANNLINAKGLLHPHAGVNVTLHSSSTQIAVHTKDGEIQPGTSWRMKVFTKAAFLSWLQRNRETIIDELSKAIVLKSCGETESSAANTLYQERRIEHAKQLSEYIEKVRNHTDSNATYAINYDFTKAAAADVNRYRAAEMSCRKLNMLQEAEKWANEAKAVIHDPKSYVLTSLLANHDSFHGSSMSVGLIAYGKHGSGAYERSFEIFSGNPSKNIPLQVELENDPDEDEIALEPHLTEERQAPRRSVARHSLMQMNLMRHLPPANINHIRR